MSDLGTVTIGSGCTDCWTNIGASLEEASRAAGGLGNFYNGQGSYRPTNPAPVASPQPANPEQPVAPEPLGEVTVSNQRNTDVPLVAVIGGIGTTPYFNPFAGSPRPAPRPSRRAPPRRSPPKPQRTRPTRPGTRPATPRPVRYTPRPTPLPRPLTRVASLAGRLLSRLALPVTLLLHPLRSGPSDEYPTGPLFPGFEPNRRERERSDSLGTATVAQPRLSGLPSAAPDLGTVVISPARPDPRTSPRGNPAPLPVIAPGVLVGSNPLPPPAVSPRNSAAPGPVVSPAPLPGLSPGLNPRAGSKPKSAKKPGKPPSVNPELGPSPKKTVCSCKTVDPNKQKSKKKKKKKKEKQEFAEIEVEYKLPKKLGSLKLEGEVKKYCFKPRRGKRICR